MDLPQYPSSLDFSYYVSLELSFYVFLCYSLLTIHTIYLPFNWDTQDQKGQEASWIGHKGNTRSQYLTTQVPWKNLALSTGSNGRLLIFSNYHHPPTTLTTSLALSTPKVPRSISSSSSDSWTHRWITNPDPCQGHSWPILQVSISIWYRCQPLGNQWRPRIEKTILTQTSRIGY